MEMVIYSVHDCVAETWSFPQVSPTVASACRDFAVLKSKSGLPGTDIECVFLGTWSSDTGIINPKDHRILVPADSKESNG